MSSSRKSPRLWYARAMEFRHQAESLPEPVRKTGELRYSETELEFEERVTVYELTKRRLLRESDRCWAAGGRIAHENEMARSRLENTVG